LAPIRVRRAIISVRGAAAAYQITRRPPAIRHHPVRLPTTRLRRADLRPGDLRRVHSHLLRRLALNPAPDRRQAAAMPAVRHAEALPLNWSRVKARPLGGEQLLHFGDEFAQMDRL